MSTPSGLPERQSRARSGIGEGPSRLPTIGQDNSVDLDRLRASAISAITAEAEADADSGIPDSGVPDKVAGSAIADHDALRSDARRNGAPPSDAERRTGDGRRSGDGRGVPAWMKLAVPVALAIGIVALGVSLMGGDDTVATEDRSTVTEVAPTTEAPATTAAPTTEVAPTTEAPPATEAAPTTVAAAAPVADPNAPPPHKATYRAGKLYLEGRVASAEESQKYVDKAAAVLGPENVVNNYAIDPAVPVSTDGTVYVDEPFLFETGSSQLNPQYTGVLGLGIAALKLSPSARMAVTGYTDSTGDPARNDELSLARATSVVDYMVTAGGIDRARFDVVGAGDRNPVGDNATPEGRQLNRRIDVKLLNLLG